ncbi:MAG: alpha/beta hydrolase [Thermoanaerobaculia bacterium]
MRSRSLAATVLLALLATVPVCEAKPAVKDAFLTLPDGAKIHYLEAGQGSPIVFIPGWTMAADIWEGQIAYFSKSHRVVAYDPRSQGRSSKTPEGSYPIARGADLHSILDQLHLNQATLVCWSMAAAECAAYIDFYGSGQIAGLVLVDGAVGDLADPQRVAGTLQYIAQVQKNRRALTESFVRSMYKKPQSEAYLKHVLDESLQTPTDTAIALFVGTLAWDGSKALARIDKPTLLAVTENPFMATYEKMHAAIAGSRMEVFQAGHALFVDEPEKFNKLVEEFVGSLGKPAR